MSERRAYDLYGLIRAVRDSELDHHQSHVLLILASYVNLDGQTFVGVDTLARKTRLSPRTTQKVLQSLEGEGVLVRSFDAGRTVRTIDIEAVGRACGRERGTRQGTPARATPPRTGNAPVRATPPALPGPPQGRQGPPRTGDGPPPLPATGTPRTGSTRSDPASASEKLPRGTVPAPAAPPHSDKPNGHTPVDPHVEWVTAQALDSLRHASPVEQGELLGEYDSPDSDLIGRARQAWDRSATRPKGATTDEHYRAGFKLAAAQWRERASRPATQGPPMARA